MGKKSRRANRLNRVRNKGAFGNPVNKSSGGGGGKACPRPALFGGERCCMCGDDLMVCPCTAQKAINHYMDSHITDDCGEIGHPSVAEMVVAGMPTPTVPCRNCGEVVKMVM